MAGEIICACCHHKVDENSKPRCDYCGFVNIAMVGNTKFSDREALEYRKELVANVQNISIVTYEYGWNEKTNNYEKLSEKKHKIADGLDCDGKIVWSKLDFGQWWDENEKTVPVTITFQCGKGWTFTSKFVPIDSPAFWHVGVTITEDTRIAVVFGSEQKYAQSTGVEFVPLLSK